MALPDLEHGAVRLRQPGHMLDRLLHVIHAEAWAVSGIAHASSASTCIAESQASVSAHVAAVAQVRVFCRVRPASDSCVSCAAPDGSSVQASCDDAPRCS